MLVCTYMHERKINYDFYFWPLYLIVISEMQKMQGLWKSKCVGSTFAIFFLFESSYFQWR